MNSLTPDRIRNLAIIAHVDHGKTTLVDQLLRHSGSFRENQSLDERAMDSMAQEKERGITIKAKNTSVRWGEYLINIVDTPGHADFGGEVERVMKMVDGVMLVVDAYEGPQAQTRFVLQKALAAGLNPVVFVNKIDRPNARPEEMQDSVLELFLELEAKEEQFDAPFLYGSAKDGYARLSLDHKDNDMQPLFQAIVDSVPAPQIEESDDFRMLVSNVDWSDYVGRIGIGKILSGTVKVGQPIWRFVKMLTLSAEKSQKFLSILHFPLRTQTKEWQEILWELLAWRSWILGKLLQVLKSQTLYHLWKLTLPRSR